MNLNLKSNRVFLSIIGLVLAVLASLRDFSVPDEGRYGDISRWMVMSHDYLVPRINGVPFLHKPPLLHWLTAGLMEVFGTHIWVARLIPVLAAMVILSSLCWFVTRHISQTIARLSVLILATSFLFYGASQYVNHDMLVAAWITLASFCIADFVLKGDKKVLMLGFIVCGLGFLSKGLIGVLIPGMILLPWLLWTKQWRKIPSIFHPLGMGLFLLIVLPWALLMNQHYVGFLQYFFIEQQFDRFSSTGFNNHQPWFFYAACLVVSFLPYLVFAKFKLWDKTTSQQLGKPIFSLLVWWALSCLVFFSIPTSKLVGYILPTVAPLAILLAVAVDKAQHTARKHGNVLTWQRYGRGYAQGYFAPSLLLVLAGGLVFALLRLPEQKIYTPNAALMVGVVLAGAAMGLMVELWRKRVPALAVTVVSSALICVLITTAVQAFDVNKNANQLSFRQYVTPATPIIFYQNYFYDLPFYLQTQSPVYVVKDWASIKEDNSFLELKDGLRFEPDMSQYLIDEPRFTQLIHRPERLVIVSGKKEVPDLTGLTYKIVPYRNFDVYVINP